MTSGTSAGPLSHITVIDLTRARSGPTAVRQLADWGARVVQIASRAEDYDDFPRRNSDTQNLRRNTRNITIDLRKPEGVAILKQLVAMADVVVENYRPGVKHRLGIDYEALSAINPRLVYGSISGFGQDGPYADRPGFDQIAQGLGGMMSITGLPGQGPVRAGIPVADLSAGLFLAQGILVALLERERSGRGQWVTTSLLEAQVAMLDFQTTRWLIDGEVPPQAGNEHPTTIPTGVYETSDGYINIATTGQTMWRKLCEALGVPEIIEDPRFATPVDRSTNRAALNPLLSAPVRTRSSAEWVEVLNQVGIPCGPIYDVKQVFEDEQVRHLGLDTTVTHPALGELRVQRHPVTLSRTPASVRSAAPDLGAHNDEVLGELGYTPAQIEQLRTDAVI
jgi:crotonobetainyl-CoA:carnitine CoA-transferase CaiB-like acyl-CoA transferase